MISIFYKEKNELTPIALEKCTLRRDKDGNRHARMRFSIELNVGVAMSSPPAVRAAFEAVGVLENKIVEVESALEIDGIGVEFYSLPAKKNCSLALPSVSLIDFTVESRGGLIYLLFSINLKLDENVKLRHWIVDNIFSQIWAEFTVQQMVLMPGVDTQSKGDAVQ